jgi:DNA-binding transcriptional LysR family regulator
MEPGTQILLGLRPPGLGRGNSLTGRLSLHQLIAQILGDLGRAVGGKERDSTCLGTVHGYKRRFRALHGARRHSVVRGPSFSFGEDIAAGRLVPLLTDWHTRELSIYALYPHRSMLSAKVRSFVDLLIERFGPEPEWEGWRRPKQT